LEIRPGFSAFVGPNNSGKSTLLKAIRELKAVFGSLADLNIVTAFAKGNPYGFGQYTDVEDAEEIFCDATSGPVVLELTFHGALANELSRVRLVCSRGQPSTWNAEVFIGPDLNPLPATEVAQHGLTISVASGNRQAVDIGRAQRFGRLVSGSMYVPPFRHALTGTGGSMGDLLNGSEFLTAWANYQGGGNKAQKRLIGKVVADVKSLFSYESLNVQPAVGNSTLQLWVNGRDYRLREMGSGLVQFLLVLGNAAFKTPSLIFIDEPELNLHPTLQQEFLTALGGYCDYGLLFATHSLGLARTAADFLYSVRKTNGIATVSPWESAAQMGELLGELSYSAYREGGHERVLAVEGIQDIRPVQQILRLLRLEYSTLVIPLGGDQIASDASVETVAELRRLAKNVFVLLDSERDKSGGPPKTGRQEFVDQCAHVGVRVHLTERRAIENYFSDRAIKLAFGPEFSSLESFAERQCAQNSWSKRENWRAAREMTLEEWEASDVLNFIKSIAA